MSKGKDEAGITPSALSEYVHYVEQKHRRTVHFVLDHTCRPSAACGFTIRCLAYQPNVDSVNEVREHAQIQWPTYSHKTMLGAMYWLLLTVEAEMDAGDVLALLSGSSAV